MPSGHVVITRAFEHAGAVVALAVVDGGRGGRVLVVGIGTVEPATVVGIDVGGAGVERGVHLRRSPRAHPRP